MSLLWTTAMPWWNNERRFDFEGDDEYPLRDPGESLAARGRRYQQKVVENHGVTPEVAQKSIKHVLKGMSKGEVWGDPKEYGFASSSRTPLSFLMSSHEKASKIYRGDTWNHLPVQPVDLSEPIHATQDFVRHRGVAHNLFHPGKVAPRSEEDGEGDPDYEPDEPDYGWDDPDENKHTSHPRFIRMNNGKLMAMDGHHRIATDLLLGKSHTMGRVLHERDL
jgi:hypothetical protein